ncbi:MAG: MTH1187 family thiamine-binding protein [Caldisericota bacterium]|nr:MTH1187 family thiamine-binding protein [Caldisericota bacterium]
MAIAEFSVLPVIPEEQVNEIVEKAIQVVIDSGLKYEVEANSTTVEGDLEQLLDVIKQAHITAREQGSGRVITVIKIDDKKGGITIKEKVKKFRKEA